MPVTIEGTGGGGRGGNASGINSAAGGGAGGSYARSSVSLIAATSYTISIGAGATTGSAGGPTYFDVSGSHIIYATGGGSSSDVTADNGVSAGGNHLTLGATGDVKYYGGDGGDAVAGAIAAFGAGGGAAYGSTGGSAAGTDPGLGSGIYGGDGGGAEGENGFAYGGGGAGAYSPDGSSAIGGAGYQGILVITYYITA